MKTKQENIRQAMIKKLKDNTIFQNAYDQLHVVDENGTQICIGAVSSCNDEVLAHALKNNGFIC